MNREDIIRMARDSDLIYWRPNSKFSDGVWWMDAGEPGDEIERFAALVAAAERDWVINLLNTEYSFTPPQIVEALRARGRP